ncbi:MAG: helix-turn-helix transcriptional regulator [Actinobacteria bacterium]|nr:helix-turn-helix transcriptional regulator [Actinomycetota bacterium]
MTSVECEPLTWTSKRDIDVDHQRRLEVSRFLRSRRARLSPEDLGLEPGPRRRTPGLRRKEVAARAGVSVTWYTWLEQARPINVSTDVIDALCRALRLDESEWRHVRRLIGLPTPIIEHHGADIRTIRAVVDALGVLPAVALDSCLDIIVTNEAQKALFGDPSTLPPHRQNLLWWMFGDTDMRRSIADWDESATMLVAWFRAECGKHPGDRRSIELVDELSRESNDFNERWKRGEVKQFMGRQYTVRHDRYGVFCLENTQLRVVDHPSVTILVSVPVEARSQGVLHQIAASLADASCAETL